MIISGYAVVADWAILEILMTPNSTKRSVNNTVGNVQDQAHPKICPMIIAIMTIELVHKNLNLLVLRKDLNHAFLCQYQSNLPTTFHS